MGQNSQKKYYKHIKRPNDIPIQYFNHTSKNSHREGRVKQKNTKQLYKNHKYRTPLTNISNH